MNEVHGDRIEGVEAIAAQIDEKSARLRETNDTAGMQILLGEINELLVRLVKVDPRFESNVRPLIQQQLDVIRDYIKNPYYTEHSVEVKRS